MSSPREEDPGAPVTESSSAPFDTFVAQWRICISELEQLEICAAESPSAHIHNLGVLVKSQRNSLDRFVRKDAQTRDSAPGLPESQELEAMRIFNSDMASWRAIWPVMKKFHGLLHVNKKFFRGPRHAVEPPLDWLELVKQRPREEPVLFDAVVDCGKTWLKFIRTSHQAVLKQIHRARWELGYADGDVSSDDGEGGGEKDDGEPDQEELLRSTDLFHHARAAVQAARWNHCRRLHFVLVNIETGSAEDIDALLGLIRGLSDECLEVVVSCSNEPFVKDPPPPLDTAINNLLERNGEATIEDDYRLITPDIANLDPSVLLSLASDVLHGPVPQQPEGQRIVVTKAIEAQKDSLERKGKPWQYTLESILYPALRSRRLVCTKAAAAYFWEVVGAIGTASEETRAGLIVARPGHSAEAQADIRTEFQRWSNIPLPEDFQLPIEVVDDITLGDVDQLVRQGTLPPMAAKVARDVSPLNRSVHFYGWAHRMTTVTSHRGIPRQIELSIARHWTPSGDEYGPNICTRNFQGYLVHREKNVRWRDMIPGEIPPEIRRWTNDWDTWGRGIGSYGLPDSKTWEGVGHPGIQRFGRSGKNEDGEMEQSHGRTDKVILPWDKS